MKTLTGQQCPYISVMLTIADTTEIERLVVSGDLELGAIGSMGAHKSLICHELWKDELVLAVPVDHRWAGKETTSPEQLFEEPFILRELGSGTLKIMEDYLRGLGIKTMKSLQVVARFGSSTAVKEGIKAGLWVSILSSRAIDTEVRTGMVRTLRIRGLRMQRNFYLIRDRRRIASPLCQAMSDFLLTHSREEKTKLNFHRSP